MTTVTFIFQGYLRELLKKGRGTAPSFVHRFDRRASIKDMIESFGIPHPLIDELSVNGREVGFDHILQDNETVEVRPLKAPVDPLKPSILRPEPLQKIGFAVDVNAGKLALYLRMLGFDTLYENDVRDTRLAETARSQERILLTRDTSLLKRKVVMHGYLLRKQEPKEQLVEVLDLYGLAGRIKPLSRCISCNGLLVPVSKEAVVDRLEPLTKKYYNTFQTCENCSKVYWPGSHQEKIHDFIKEVLAAVKGASA